MIELLEGEIEVLVPCMKALARIREEAGDGPLDRETVYDRADKALARVNVMTPCGERLRTKSGTEITPELLARLVVEAEEGYDPASLRPRRLDAGERHDHRL